MFAIKIELVLFFMIIHVSYCQRRIKDGEIVVEDKKYVVYLVKAPISRVAYDFWLCGGAIVSSEFVITSAACVNDVDYLYVIAGYKKYVPDSDLEMDKCTSKMKKKIIYTCSPKDYLLKYGELDYWSYIDIALVRVESPFDFNDTAYETFCSYKPTTIPINYESKYQEPGIDALVLGWGHKDGWRKPGDTNNYNEEFLRYAPTLLLNKTICTEHYEDYTNMSDVINRYMICSLGKGNIDDSGNTIQKSLPIENGCTTRQQKVLGFEGVSCEPKSTEETSEEDARKYSKNQQTNNESSSEFLNDTYLLNFIDDPRRSGICQNDHGGPLVTWSGAREILIGIASVFKVSDESECMGPFLYTSTLCVGLFLDCILTSETLPETKPSRRDLCDRPPSERGYDTIERYISWKDHPAGPADNERVGRASKKTGPGNKYSANKNQAPRPNHRGSKHEEEETDDDSNEMHSAKQKSSLRGSFPNEGRHFENVRNPPKEYARNKRPPEAVGNPMNEKFPENKMFPGYDHPPLSVRNPPPNVRNPQFDMRNPQLNVRNPPLNSWNPPVNDRYPGTNHYPVNGGFPGHDRYTENNRYSTNHPRGVNVWGPPTAKIPPKAPGVKTYPEASWHPMHVEQPQIAPPKKPFAVRPQRPLRI